MEDEEENSSPSEHTSSKKPNSEEPLLEYPSSEHRTGEDPQIQGDVIKSKNLGVQESVRWMVFGADRICHDGLI